MEFVEITLTSYEDWPDLSKNILWSDEAVSHIGGLVNCHNYHYRADEGHRLRLLCEKNLRIDLDNDMVWNDIKKDCRSFHLSEYHS